MKLNAKQLRVTRPTEEELAKIQRKPIYFVLDNVLDTYNVGSLFRLADAVAAKEVILCGGTERPPSSRIHKAAVGTETWVPWEYFSTAKEALIELGIRNKELRIIAVEQDKRSVSLFNITPELRSSPLNLRGDRGVILVVGHETEGISKEVLNMADTIVEIPMFGINKSLNVHVAAAVVIYKLLEMI
ncbi:TrmH family RNA methyltransferase [Candidatus Amesbacteria bacterium]|nr:TrmH family RNA methyltransferase [Candidatus Amesbacteria bacterium]